MMYEVVMGIVDYAMSGPFAFAGVMLLLCTPVWLISRWRPITINHGVVHTHHHIDRKLTQREIAESIAESAA